MSGGFTDVWGLAGEKNPDLVFAVKCFRVYEEYRTDNLHRV